MAIPAEERNVPGSSGGKEFVMFLLSACIWLIACHASWESDQASGLHKSCESPQGTAVLPSLHSGMFPTVTHSAPAGKFDTFKPFVYPDEEMRPAAKRRNIRGVGCPRCAADGRARGDTAHHQQHCTEDLGDRRLRKPGRVRIPPQSPPPLPPFHVVRGTIHCQHTR